MEKKTIVCRDVVCICSTNLSTKKKSAVFNYPTQIGTKENK